jgi:hypothetical protein
LAAARAAVLEADVLEHLHRGGDEVELLRGFLADPHQGGAVVWAKLIVLGDIVRDFARGKPAGIFLVLVFFR